MGLRRNERRGGEQRGGVNEISMYRVYPTEKRHYINPTREESWVSFFFSPPAIFARISRV